MARYRRSHAGSGVSLECETEHVPGDGRFHIVREGRVVSGHKSLKMGTAAYLKLIEELGFSIRPPTAMAGSPAPGEVSAPSRLIGDFYVYGKSRRRKTGTRTYG